MPQLTTKERDIFLNEREILMRIAVTRENGSPLVTPIWYLYEKDTIFFTPREKSEWFSCLRHDPRVALCIDEQALPYRKVLIEGNAKLIHDIKEDDQWREQYRRIAERYVTKDGAEAYIQNTIDQPRGLFSVSLKNSKVTSWRMPIRDENGMGIWHKRYYIPDTKF